MAPTRSDHSEPTSGSSSGPVPPEQRRCAPAAERNTAPILSVLRHVLPRQGQALEIASGTGQHAVAFSRAFPHLSWQPSDIDDDALQSVKAWSDDAALDNLKQPLRLDVNDPDWPARFDRGSFDAVLAINLVHIVPWETAAGLIAGSGTILAKNGVLCLYGPYAVNGRHTAASNAEFDRWLRSQNGAWGVRDVDAIETLAAQCGLELEQRVDMPANNLTLVLRKC